MAGDSPVAVPWTCCRENVGWGPARLGISRSLYVYRSRRPACSGLHNRICELAGEKRRYGYRRMPSSFGRNSANL
jgi:hypothetical protein